MLQLPICLNPRHNCRVTWNQKTVVVVPNVFRVFRPEPRLLGLGASDSLESWLDSLERAPFVAARRLNSEVGRGLVPVVRLTPSASTSTSTSSTILVLGSSAASTTRGPSTRTSRSPIITSGSLVTLVLLLGL